MFLQDQHEASLQGFLEDKYNVLIVTSVLIIEEITSLTPKPYSMGTDEQTL